MLPTDIRTYVETKWEQIRNYLSFMMIDEDMGTVPYVKIISSYFQTRFFYELFVGTILSRSSVAIFHRVAKFHAQ